MLRLLARQPRILHVPRVLYHWRAIAGSTASGPAAKPQAHRRAAAALENYLQSSGRRGRVEDGPSTGFHRIRYEILGEPKVSIVIPSAARATVRGGRQTWFVAECVASIRRLSTYRNLEIIVVDNNDVPAELAAALNQLEVRRVSFTEPFNLSRKINLGAAAAGGEQLLLLNDDVEVISPDWIQSLLEFSQWPEIGAVGAQLLFPGRTQQHNGVAVLNGNPGHPFYQFPAEHPGYFFSSAVHRNCMAVTGACMMTRAAVFRRLGGFSDEFRVKYNDVDYCLKILAADMRIVYMPYARLYHHESVSVKESDGDELQRFKSKWLGRFGAIRITIRICRCGPAISASTEARS